MQTRDQIKDQMRDNAQHVRRGEVSLSLVLEPLVLAHDSLFDLEDRFDEMLEAEADRQTVLRLLEGSETPRAYWTERDLALRAL